MEQKRDKKKTLKMKKKKQLIPIENLSEPSSDPDDEEELLNYTVTQKEIKQQKQEQQQSQKKDSNNQESSKKRPRAESEESKSSHKTNQSKRDEKSESGGDVINVDFELVQPCESYYHNVRGLLNQYLDGDEGDNLDLSGLADLVVNTISIGSVITSSLEQDPENMPEYKDLNEEEFNKIALKYNNTRDVYGFTTILSLTKRQKQNKCFQQILSYVKAKAEINCNQNQKVLLNQALDKKNVGLLLNERLVNMPVLLVPQLHQSLPEDLKFTKKQDDIENPKEFDYEYLLVISRYTIENERKGQSQDKRQKTSQERLYYKYEDEIFSKHAEVSFSFKTTFKETLEDGTKKLFLSGGGPETPYKLVYLIKYSEYEKRIKEL